MAEELLLKPLAESESIAECGCRYIWAFITLPFVIWYMLTVRIHSPKCHLEQLYLPALDLPPPPEYSLLNATASATATATATMNPSNVLFFDLELENAMEDHSVSYSDIHLTFYYGSNRNLAIANYTIPGFYQGRGKKAYRRGLAETNGSTMLWDDAMKVVSNGSTAVFRVDLVARPKFKYLFFYSKRRWLKVGAKVEVDATGRKVKKGAIALKSAAARDRGGPGLVRVLALLSFFVVHLVVLL